MNLHYIEQAPTKWTFEMPELKLWIESWCIGNVLNLFAGKTRLNVNEYRVDINKEMPADWYGDALEFVKTTNKTFDTIILDPPYNLRKAREKYSGMYIGSFTKIKTLLPKLVNPGGRIISLGYSSCGMSRKRGFHKIAICLVCHHGDHNDTIALVEEQFQGSIV